MLSCFACTDALRCETKVECDSEQVMGMAYSSGMLIVNLVH